MKKLLVIAFMLAIAAGCTRETRKQKEARFEPKLSFGQEVTVATGFYKGTTVKVRSVERCTEDNNGTYATDVVCYSVTLVGPSGEQMSLTNFAEREILGE